jgi:hypothetical protein
VVTIDWVTVGDPGNDGDTEVMVCCAGSIGTSGYGSVTYVYRIGKIEVTDSQYSEFLNAVATTDTNALYDTGMGGLFTGGISRPAPRGVTATPHWLAARIFRSPMVPALDQHFWALDHAAE